MQQDAHEFLNFLINHINEIIVAEQSQQQQQQQQQSNGGKPKESPASNNGTSTTDSYVSNVGSISSNGSATLGANNVAGDDGKSHTWVNDIFQVIETFACIC